MATPGPSAVPRAEDWPRSTDSELVAPLLVRRLAALLDQDGSGVVARGVLPPLWHWTVFAETAPQSALGRDGHPERGGVLSTAEFPRRMFAGGRLTVDQPLRIGSEVTRTSEAVRIEEKEGRRGRLVFVTLRDQLTDPGGGRVTEERDLVYLGGRGGAASDSDTAGDPPEAPWSEDFVPDPVLLFRFSAVTFNGHRIHYDQPYATEEEGYAGLVVHGPLLALRLCELGRARAGADVRSFAFRARRPVVAGQQVALRGWPEGETVRLAAYRAGSPDPVMTAELSTGDLSPGAESGG